LAIPVEDFYRRYAPMVLRRCRRLLGEEEQAADAMHDVFVQLLVHHERLVGDGASSLMYRIATNVCLNRLRSRARRPEDPDSARVYDLVRSVEPEPQAEARSLLDRALGRAPVSSATIAVLHHLDGLTHAEVAEIVGMSVSGVRKRLRTLEAELRRLESAP
jgi:RNA polymerase sigma-70 factor (ECF subfamily)